MDDLRTLKLTNEVHSAARSLSGVADVDPVLDLIGDAPLVLLGEATHGTREFYQTRAAITRRLIAERGFDAVAEEGIHVSVRAQLDGRTARATTNKTDADSLRRVAERAVESARLQPQNPDLLPMPGLQTHQSVDRFSEETAALTPDARAEAVGKVVARAQKNNLTAAGILSSVVSVAALLNSRGLFAQHRETKAEFSVTFLDGGSGWAKGNFVSVRDLNVEELAARACERSGVHTIALGGGVFQNARLLVRTRERLESLGLEVLVPRALSPNDGGVSYGQAAVAAARLADAR